MRGKLIVIEGLDGSGKATQAELLEESLLRSGMPVKRLSFPDYAHPSSVLVQMYLRGEFGNDPENVNAYGASSFYAVDRYASYLKFWKKDYEAGCILLADRYTTSNAIYQMTKLPQSEWCDYLGWLKEYEYGRLGLPQPDITFYLDVSPEITQELITRRYHGDESKKDLHERNQAYLRQCHRTAQFSAQKLGWCCVSCMAGTRLRSIAEIHEDLTAKVRGVLEPEYPYIKKNENEASV